MITTSLYDMKFVFTVLPTGRSAVFPVRELETYMYNVHVRIVKTKNRGYIQRETSGKGPYAGADYKRTLSPGRL